MEVFIVSDENEVLGVFTQEAEALDFGRHATKVLGGADVRVEQATVGEGFVRNPWTGKQYECSGVA